MSTAAPGKTSRSCIAVDGNKGPAALATKRTRVFGTPPFAAFAAAFAEFTTSMCMVGAP